jgi:GNAT superfamily N-acetyltransferase
MNKLKIKNISLETLPYFESCFANNGSPKDTNKVRWQFLNNPSKKQFVDMAFDAKANKTAAVYAIFPVKFKLQDESLLGAQSLDTMTDKNYRGQGLFIKLANSVYERAKSEDIKLVYGFPNGNSIYGFQKKLEWEVLDPVPFLIKPLKSKYFTKRLPFLKHLPNIPLSFSKFKVFKDYKIEFKDEFPIEVNAIWESFSENIGVAINRNKEYLDWRYLVKPNEDYKLLHCSTSSGKYLGYVIYSVKGKHGGEIGYIMELVYDLEYQLAGKMLLKKAISEIKLQNADCILSWCLDHSPSYNIFKRENFFKMPEKLRPIELHFGARAFDKKFKDLVSNRKNWYLSYSDSDTV